MFQTSKKTFPDDPIVTTTKTGALRMRQHNLLSSGKVSNGSVIDPLQGAPQALHRKRSLYIQLGTARTAQTFFCLRAAVPMVIANACTQERDSSLKQSAMCHAQEGWPTCPGHQTRNTIICKGLRSIFPSVCLGDEDSAGTSSHLLGLSGDQSL